MLTALLYTHISYQAISFVWHPKSAPKKNIPRTTTCWTKTEEEAIRKRKSNIIVSYKLLIEVMFWEIFRLLQAFQMKHRAALTAVACTPHRTQHD